MTGDTRNTTQRNRKPIVEITSFGNAFLPGLMPNAEVSNITSYLQPLKWGTDVMPYPGNPSQIPDVIHSLGKANFKAITFKIELLGLNKSDPDIETPKGTLSVAIINSESDLVAKKPLDLSKFTGSVQYTSIWGTDWQIAFTKSVKLNSSDAETRETNFATQSIVTPNGNKTIAGVRIAPANAISASGAEFEIPKQILRPNRAWLEFFSTMGGALTIILGVFKFLFGQRRLRPWGIVQQFFLRKRILAALPPPVATVGTFTSAHKAKERADSAIGEEEACEHKNSTLPAAFARKPITGRAVE
ncbi:hypothetical protein THASP1DRAFT_33761 [Thamnocephalis sphaerospora]|uniref:Uncharacterized protein n=1 Tax=Thamnocephalis sphaerospora TaxID=78915 RepID=A0A4P9XH12_9FUNG|nr:hypothetical protein THASP1DRAFT_33761 [Thamnocephalis sphaerospora]|eukprot:RKP04470.1 hypothetical protein THASP1DRAFT_33761 [Thamnocephalis sphaerospora]